MNNKSEMGTVERVFETLLWNSRYFIILGVLASIFAAILLVLSASLEAVHLAGSFFNFIFSTGIEVPRNSIILQLVEMIDGFLMAGMMFIFGFGLYELFISPINISSKNNPDEESIVKGKILNIKNIDELKSKLAKIIMMVLIVKLFYFIIDLKPTDITGALMYAGCIALIGLALFLSHSEHK